MRKADVFAGSQTIVFSPILKESEQIQAQYFLYLRGLIRLVKCDKRKYTKAQLSFYQNILCGDELLIRTTPKVDFPSRFCYLLPYDFALMLAFDPKVICAERITAVINKVIADFKLPADAAAFMHREFEAALGDEDAWHEVVKSKVIKGFKRYLGLVKKNIHFIRQRPYNILITANMSAGKSTLINALTGKNICPMQNMACTSKIHTIMSKPFDDGVTSECDHSLVLDATKEDLLNDNEENTTSKITVGTFFDGAMSGSRVVLFDTPGVNSSENLEHKEISSKMISSKKYQLLVYVINATQLSVDDEKLHLEAVKEYVGRKPVIFVINKADCMITEDDNVFEVIDRQRKFLLSVGFKNPIICPISSRAAYLAKKSHNVELSWMEQSELLNFVCKFKEQGLADYYVHHLNCTPIAASHDEVHELLGNCGFAYLEKIIEHLYNGGKINGTGLC